MQAVVSPTTVLKLGSADFVIYDKDNHSLGIERKAVSDLLSSLSSSRLYRQLERMRNDYTNQALLIEGELGYNVVTRKVQIDGLDTGWNHGSLQMILWNFEFRDAVTIYRTSDRYATADLLRILHNRSLRGCVLPHG